MESEPTSEFKVGPHTVYLRAVAGTITGADLLYTAAGCLMHHDSDNARAHNNAVILMVTRLLQLPNTNPEAVEYVLRTLPERLSS